MTTLGLDMFLTLARYAIIAWGLHHGFADEMNDALVGIGTAAITILWGLYASGYWHRFINWFKSLSKDV